jgi:predicted transposase YdaD
MTQPPLHDVLFREGFSLPRVARQFLTRWLAPEFLALVDWSSLEIQRITGINTALAERKADIVYRVRAGGIRIWFYLLVEHQSTPDPHMPLRVLEYTVLIWQSIAQHLWTYLLHHSELKSPEIRQIVNSTIPETVRESFMSTAEMLRQEGRQEAILDALEIRFAHVPDGLRETIDAIHDESRLRSIHRAAIQAASLEDFARSL